MGKLPENFVQVFKKAFYYNAEVWKLSEWDRKDAYQDAFLKAFSKFDEYDPQKSSLETWNSRIISNVCLDLLRKNNRRKAEDIEIYEENLSGQSLVFKDEKGYKVSTPVILSGGVLLSPEEEYDRKSVAGNVRAGLERINPRYKRALELWYFDGQSYEQIAESLDTNVNNVKQILCRARKAFKESYEGEKYDDQ